MKYALIDNVNYYNGKRIAQISDIKFEVHPDLKWIECDDSINEYDYIYNPNTQSLELADKNYIDPNVTIENNNIPSTYIGISETTDIFSRTELTAKIKKLENLIASLTTTK